MGARHSTQCDDCKEAIQPKDTEKSSLNVIPSEASTEKENDDLRSIECPVCYEVFKPPIFLCENGHSVCHRCQDRLDRCPVCRGKWTFIRNLQLEQVVALLSTKCKFNIYGCKRVLCEKH